MNRILLARSDIDVYWMVRNAILHSCIYLVKLEQIVFLGGGFVNNKNKEKIVFTLPEGILSEVDKIIQMENSNREDFAKAAFQFYITQKKKLNLILRKYFKSF